MTKITYALYENEKGCKREMIDFGLMAFQMQNKYKFSDKEWVAMTNGKSIKRGNLFYSCKMNVNCHFLD